MNLYMQDLKDLKQEAFRNLSSDCMYSSMMTEHMCAQ